MILFFIIAEDQFIAVKNLLDIGKGSETVFNLSYVTTLTDGRIRDCPVQDSEKKTDSQFCVAIRRSFNFPSPMR